MAGLAEKAERLGRRRSRLLLVMGWLLLALQGAYIALQRDPTAPLRTVDLITLFGWAFVVIACLIAVVTGGGHGYGAAVRALANDESTRANRDAAIRVGFAGAILTALALFALAFFEPCDAGAACHLVITVGLASALIRFGVLEWRAHRVG